MSHPCADGLSEAARTLLARRANLVHAELGVRLSMGDTLSHSTIASLALKLDRAAAEEAPSQATARVPRVARPAPPA